jgi:thioredoxin reductase
MTYHDYIVVGAGPSGLQMGYLLDAAGRDYLMLEGSEMSGKFFSKFPRHRRLNSFNKRFNWFEEADYNLRFDWHSLLTHDFSFSFKDKPYSKDIFPLADTYVEYLNDFREHFDLKVQFNTRLTYVRRDPETKHFILTTSNEGEEIRCRTLIMATGPVKPKLPEIPGIEHAVGYEDHSTNLEDYENKRVLIIGGGNSSFETANHLANSASQITVTLGNRMIKYGFKTHYIGDVRAAQNLIIDMAPLKMLHSVVGISPTKIEKLEDGQLRVHYKEELPHWTNPGVATGSMLVDYVIRCTGWIYNDESMWEPSIYPQMMENQKYPLLDCMYESTTPDVFFCGAAMDGRIRRGPNTSIHGYRYSTRAVFHYTEQRYHGIPTPNQVFPLKNKEDLVELGRALIKRISISSGLYEGFKMMADAVVFDREAGVARVFWEMPIDYFLENPYFTSKTIMVIDLEFGTENFPGADPVSFIRHNDPARPGCVAHLHPVFRAYENGKFVKGRNTRAATMVRYDEEADYFEGEMSGEKPRHILYNFLNEFAGVTDYVFPEEHYHNTEEQGGFRPAMPGEVLSNPGLPECALTLESEQVTDFEHILHGARRPDGTIGPWVHA